MKTTPTTLQNTSTRPESPRSRRLAWLATPLLLVTAAGQAEAGILDTILSRTTQARNVATTARDRATDARNRIRALGDRVQDGVQHLTGEVRDAISENAAWVRTLLEDQMAGRDVFISQEAEAFRANLIGFLLDLEALREQVSAIARPCAPDGLPQGDLSPLISLIESAPAGVLYPVWKGLDLDLCLLDSVGETVEALQTLQDILGGLDGVLGLDLDVSDVFASSTPESLDADLLAARYAAAYPYLQNYSELADASAKIQRVSMMLKLIASKLKSQGETTVQGTLGVHGYALVKVSSNPRKSMSSEIDSVAGVLDKICGAVKNKLDEAKTVSAAHLIASQQQEILDAIRSGR